MRVITFGTFDMFHIGHLNIIERASQVGIHLTVGVSSDELNFSKKQRFPICNERDRMRIVHALSCVNEVFLEESLELKAQYIKTHKADCLVMGDDWLGKFDEFKPLCDVIYLPRTPAISTTQLIEIVYEVGKNSEC
ncbi:adenylyltransferase/cytidyltransferase family protein [Shewanella sp. VB17]|uniref:adenylyltransferase/cytidyltransferase family protein n=1 Tax=Shewanella sp. VB17 TaxID=2739432 RepID=UPI00156739AC|nr:adenylyltransferase/cytidyltransferase family protein [Shewanella sp. VB17]NRD72062.1 adenylyltransferase/cytidyltransferase family protein [Shewanella sp. VB17]